ncbi:hypothetical protein ACJIZ3_001674 [Penstemon smallii]|uniref:PGG domain-containing protein n=1 Tax=Penstemon smallii TaxID=265156 RepID=A0ABD3U5P3_9LAMI
MKGSHVQREESRLYEAAAIGKVADLRELIVNNPLILDRVSYTCPNKTPLHIATLKGHLPFVQEILSLNPQLAEELDSQQSSPLHIASDKGHVDIVRELLLAAPDMCLSRDSQGRNPLHLAAIKGQVEVLIELVQSVPLAAREKLDGGLIVLHLCVKYNQLGALKILVPFLNVLINARDDHGDTILHMAVRDKQNETIQHLVERTNIDVNAQNSEGQTAFEILEQSPIDTRNSQIREILTTGLRKSNTQTRPEKWLAKKRDAIMLVAVLIATMAFQAVVSPAGGVWQEDMFHDSLGNNLLVPHRAGEAVMAHKHPRAFKSFIRSNTIAFVSSLSTILFLISGLPFRNRLVMWALMVVMWLTVTSTAVTYAICIVVITPRKDRTSVGHVMDTSIAVWCGVMGILLVGNTLRLIDRWLRNRGITVWRPKRFRSSIEGNHENSCRRENV